MPKRFNLDRSQRSILSLAIKKFNGIVDSLGVGQNLKYDYTTLRDSIRTKRQFNTVVNRIKRLFNDREQQVITNKFGTQYTRWEKKEFKRLQRAANKKRAKIREKFRDVRNLEYVPTDEELYYRDTNYSLDQAGSRETIDRWFMNLTNLLQDDYEDRRDLQFKLNLVKSLGEWPEIDPIQRLKGLIMNADVADLRVLVADSRFDVSLNNNYAALYAVVDDTDIWNAANDLLERWETNLAFLAEQRAIDEGLK